MTKRCSGFLALTHWKKKMTQTGKLSVLELQKKLQKSNKNLRTFNLKEENITDVTDWIPTGSRWLDSIICKGKLAGIPVGKITEIAGLSSSGKSYMAMQIAINAQKKGYNVIYFDSEVAIDSEFVENMGLDLDEIMYVAPKSVEHVLETIEEVLKHSTHNVFIWDSLAFTPAEGDIESDYNPTSSMALKARILAKGLPKLLVPLADTQSALICLNQLKENIPTGPNARIEKMKHPYKTPGGLALVYAYSLRIWLTKREAKKMDILNEKGFKIGNEVKVHIEKSRFGSEKRVCSFQIVWGDSEKLGILDEKSWLEAIKPSQYVESGTWWKILNKKDPKKVDFNFQSSGFEEKLKEDEKFRKRVLEIMDEEVIENYAKQTKDASAFEKLEDDS